MKLVIVLEKLITQKFLAPFPVLTSPVTTLLVKTNETFLLLVHFNNNKMKKSFNQFYIPTFSIPTENIKKSEVF